MTPTALLIRTAGTNCDRELAHAFELAGATPHTVHLNRLIDESAVLESADIIAVPGGFSYGDDIAAGRIFANRLRHRLIAPLRSALSQGVPMIGICNGFQVLAKLGLLPDWQSDGGAQTATLAANTSGRFIDRWVRLQAQHDSPCIWTQGLDELELPVAHAEGRFVTASDDSLQRLIDRGQVALRYARGDNPNGSRADIAGICDPTGRILGLMPHPERFTHFSHHPMWTRRPSNGQDETPAGLRFFLNAVNHVKAAAAVSSPC